MLYLFSVNIELMINKIAIGYNKIIIYLNFSKLKKLKLYLVVFYNFDIGIENRLLLETFGKIFILYQSSLVYITIQKFL